ncbi:hypothetical protein PTTG_06098 [Puccinia triticina 1-1 BBBD Race 1]|uniref:Bud emergence protein 1 n=1 Tax=Puccinia triticina (isolate 1-1 / race 1 (BBBD)) TaxID=630390 RepID=A0A180H4P6_PUCT1|nr:hypothetical protein PTTG_06098 [Puccinia triticina 1-1 BBBD Race 1]
MKVLRRSLHKEKDRISAGSPTRPDFSHPPPPSSNKHSSKQLPTQPFASLAAGSQNPTNPRSIGKPPTLVIKAITAYKSKRIVELSFQKGDFFHVVGERDDHEGSWFEASNPATGARGIVPKHCFELFGKKQNELPSTTPTATTFPPRSSAPGFQSSAIHQPSSPLLVRTPLSADPFRTNNPNSKTQPLYGIVQHDFVAERPDELDAKRGEPIIVIAQSNHEWFVAKPIGRLGGPGLIPVSFVEVQDVNTGKALAPNQVQDLIRSSVVPAVEEWKKATAAYKGNSIPLGKFDFAASSPPMPATNSHVSANPGSFNHPTSSRSTSTSHTRQQSSGVGYDHPSSARAPQHDSWHGAGGGGDPSAYNRHSRQSSTNAPWNGPSTSSRQSPTQQGRHYQDELHPESGPEGDGYATVDELRERYGVVVHASVESFHFEQGHYWFHLRAHFSRISEDGQDEQTTVLVLYRLYEDFYDFQAALIETFPDQAGGPNLPRMPGPTDNVDELVCAQRVEDLSTYLHELCELPLYIRESELVYEFLGPREGDVELEGDPGNLGLDDRSPTEVEGEVVEYLQRMDSSHGDDGRLTELNESISRLSTGSNGPPDSYQHHQHHRRQSSHASQPGYHSRMSRGSTGPAGYHHRAQRSQDLRPFSSSTTSSEGLSSHLPSTHTSASSVQLGSRVTSMTPAGPIDHQRVSSTNTTNPSTGFLRIKIYQRQTDDLIAIRAPTGVQFQELLQRIQERVGTDVRSIRFRDESGAGYSTGGSTPLNANNGARLIGIDNDGDLDRWIGSGNRLVLYVD